jgi:glycosyltransferase involved in cell wall biosynthesis
MTNFGKRDPESLGIRNVLVIPHLLSDSYDPALLTRAEPVPTLLYVGHICPDKGTTALLAAVAAVQSQGHRCELSLVGECLAPYTEDDLTKDIERLGLGSSVKLAGVRSGEEKWRQFAAADLFVFPSVAPESFGLVLVEAMMWALPIVGHRLERQQRDTRKSPWGSLFCPGVRSQPASDAALSEALGQRDRWDSWAGRTGSAMRGDSSAVLIALPTRLRLTQLAGRTRAGDSLALVQDDF